MRHQRRDFRLTTSLILFALVALALLLWFAADSSARQQCGSERWEVKTLADPAAAQISQDAEQTTVDYLRALRPPRRPSARVSPVEFQIYEVKAVLVGYKKETDSDFHIVIAEPGKLTHTMVVEIPSPDCAPSNGKDYQEMRDLVEQNFGTAVPRFHRLKIPAPITVQGVGFFDKLHGQTGVAPNGIELHPLTYLELD